MSKAQKDVFVKVDDEFTYRMDASRTRTLPPGWTGAIPADAAKELKKGQVLSAQAASQRKAAAKEDTNSGAEISNDQGGSEIGSNDAETGASEGANTDDQGNSVNEGNDNEKDAEQ